VKALVTAGLALLALLQGTWLTHIRLLGVMPDAVLVALTTLALLVGGVAVVPLAAAGGLLLDLLAGTPLGLSAAALLLAVLATGWWRGTVFYTGVGLFVAAALVGTLAYDGALLIGMQTWHELVDWPVALRGVVAPSAVLNGLLAIPAGYLGSWLAGRLRPVGQQ
jgi:cell shape-determining protein MreD